MFKLNFIICLILPAGLCMNLVRHKRQEKKCICVPYYKCGPDNKIDVYGTDQLDVRIPLDGEANPVCTGIDICCELPDDDDEDGHDTRGPSRPVTEKPDPIPEPPYVPDPQPPVDTNHNGEIVHPQLPPGISGCGIKRWNPLDPRFGTGDTDTRITGKNDKPVNTFFGEFPWMIAVFKEVNGKKNFVCGGSLIKPDVVLTGAHCVATSEANEVIVRAGDWDARNTDEPIPHQDREVARLSIHDDFDNGNLRNDIALLFLKKPFELNDAVDTICIEKTESFDPADCEATGWGVNSFSDERLYQPVLKKVSLPLVDRATCQNRLRGTRLGSYFKLHKSFICAGGLVNQDTCTGDGGGPLVCAGVEGDKRRYSQLGIVSWGIGCGKDTPAVYTSVSHFHEWISHQL